MVRQFGLAKYQIEVQCRHLTQHLLKVPNKRYNEDFVINGDGKDGLESEAIPQLTSFSA